MTNAPFFLTGVGRSGTTLLRLMLHHHPRLAIPYESHFISNYQRRIGEYGNLDQEENLHRLIGDILREPQLQMWDHQFDLQRTARRTQARTLRGVIEAIYVEYAEAHGKQRWGDKSDYLDEIPYLHQIFPEAKFIHVIRDGRDVALSVIALPWGPNDVMEAASWWSDYVWVARRMGAILGPERYTEVRFEDLLRNPAQELQRLCEFLGETYAPEMLRYYDDAERAIPSERRAQHYNVDKPPQASRALAWKSKMSDVEVAIFDRYARRMLDECGYERPPVAVGDLRVAVRVFGILARRFLKQR